MKNHNLRLIKRSKFRRMLGKRYYIFRRYIERLLGSTKYAKKTEKSTCEYLCFEHRTPILRKLKDVDMWMQYNKQTNLELAIQCVNGIEIKTGETFSYWKSIGNPSRFKGYKKGMVISNGHVTSGYGGGLCQLSNMIHWMVIHSDLSVTERYRHSFDLFPDVNRKQPFGSGATCVYNYRDLQVTNKTKHNYYLKFRIEDEHLVGELYSDIQPYYEHKVYEKEHIITHEPWGAYVRHNVLYKEIYDEQGELVDDIFVCENHALMMYEPLLTSNSPLA